MSKNYSKEPNEKPNYDNLKKAKEDLTEAASGTCFSSEQEDKYRKSKTVNRLTNLLTKFKGTFMPPTQAQEETGKKFGDLFDRTKWTVYMLLGFIGFIWLGNFYCALLVLLVIMAIYAELIDLSQYKDRNNEVKNYYPLAWYFFFLCIYYSYLKILMDKLTYLNANGGGVFILRYHNLICFMGYILGFGIFIKSLTKGYYKYQFRSFAWIHIILFIFGISSSLITANIFNGLVWFILPASLVICNDISAYIFGRMLGKTPLSSLSPKKTVEGFIGGLFATIVWCYMFSELLLHFEFLLCPVKEISWRPLLRPQCDVTELNKDYSISYEIPYFLYTLTLPLKKIHFHTFFLGLFASLLAPLGGLFASGFKRAIKIKDFANLIPGHGGLTDRMDCQILMGFFTYIWTYQFLFYSEQRKMNSIMNSIRSMGYDDQLKIFQFLNSTLFG